MTKILCIGDQHFKTSNIIQVNVFLTKLKEYLDSSPPDIIISMGDLLDTHERLHVVPLNKAGEYLRLLSSYCKTYVLVGNHDFLNNSVFLNTNHWLNCYKDYPNLTIIDDVTIVNINDIKITLCPYIPDGKFKLALDTKIGKWEDSNCIFAHQLFNGVKMGVIVAEDVEKWDENLPVIVSGHIHDKQRPQSNLYYTGSSMQHAFGESHDKTLSLVTLNESSHRVDEIDLLLPKKKILYIDIDDIETFDISKLEHNTEYKLTINGNHDEFQAFKKSGKYKEFIRKKLKIVFKNKRSFIIDKKEQLKEKIGIEKHNTKSFNDILTELVSNENNNFLNDLLYTIVFNQTREETDDIIIL
jgi:predicted phosphodiesterase